MGKSTIKQLAEVVNIGSSSKLYRIGNLRIFCARGTSPHGNILAEEDRPKVSIVGAGDASDSAGNLSSCLGRVAISSTTGVIECSYLSVYNSASSGYSGLYAPNTINATVIWTV